MKSLNCQAMIFLQTVREWKQIYWQSKVIKREQYTEICLIWKMAKRGGERGATASVAQQASHICSVGCDDNDRK